MAPLRVEHRSVKDKKGTHLYMSFRLNQASQEVLELLDSQEASK